MKGRKKDSHRDQMLSMIKDCLESGQTKSSYYKKLGIPQAVFYYWLRQYRQKLSPEEVFIPVHVKTPEVFLKEIEISYPNGVRLKIPEGIELSQLRSLISLQ